MASQRHEWDYPCDASPLLLTVAALKGQGGAQPLKGRGLYAVHSVIITFVLMSVYLHHIPKYLLNSQLFSCTCTKTDTAPPPNILFSPKANAVCLRDTRWGGGDTFVGNGCEGLEIGRG